MSNEIVKSADSGTIRDFENALLLINSVDDMREFVNNLDKLAKMLKAADLFNQNAKKYARLEAMTYVRIVDLGFGNQVKGRKKKVIAWISSLSEEERNHAIEVCGSEGITISVYYERFIVSEEKIADAISLMRWNGGMAVKEFNENGVVKLNDYLSKDAVMPLTPPDVLKGYKDTIRDAIRKRGGHGIHDEDGTYVKVEFADRCARDVISNKEESISRDIRRLKETIDSFAYLVRLDEFDAYSNPKKNLGHPEYCLHHKVGCYELDEQSILYVYLALLGVVFIDDEELDLATSLAWICDKLGMPVYKVCETLSKNYDENPYATGAFSRLLLAGMSEKIRVDAA